MGGTVIALLALALFPGASGIACLITAGKRLKSRGEKTGLRVAGAVLLLLAAGAGLLARAIDTVDAEPLH